MSGTCSLDPVHMKYIQNFDRLTSKSITSETGSIPGYRLSLPRSVVLFIPQSNADVLAYRKIGYLCSPSRVTAHDRCLVIWRQMTFQPLSQM
jgi:hypothetical protein